MVGTTTESRARFGFPGVITIARAIGIVTMGVKAPIVETTGVGVVVVAKLGLFVAGLGIWQLSWGHP